MTQIHPPPEDRNGALPIHFPSTSSSRSQTARLFLESIRPSSPLPTIVATVGAAAPFVKKGTLKEMSVADRQICTVLTDIPEQCPSELVDRLSAGELAAGDNLSVCVWRESFNERDEKSPDPPGSIAGMSVAGGIEYQCPSNLASRFLDCKLEELLIEICNSLVPESARARKTIA